VAAPSFEDRKRRKPLRVAVTIAAVLPLLSALTASAATAPKPKTWHWTTAQAQATRPVYVANVTPTSE
jgi:hypothetical protein